METESFSRPNLPDKNDPRYLEELISACIGAFRVFGKDSVAMNFMGVAEKLRPLVLENERYKVQTRMAKADKMLEEIEEIEQISKALKNDTPRQPKYDSRNPNQKDMDEYEKNIKENLTLRLKVAEIRRGLLSTTDEDEKDSADALNIYFIPVTREEFAALKSVEVHDGSEDASIKDQKKTEEHARSAGIVVDDQPDPFIINADGDMVEVTFP